MDLISRICLGTAQLGQIYGIANKTGKPSQEEAERILPYAVENGIEFYDTAQNYGESELLLGKTFKEISGKKRPKIITKVHPNLSSEAYLYLKSQICKSLKDLQQSCVWGVLLHRTGGVAQWQNLPAAIQKLKDDRLFLHFGVSIYEPEEALTFLNQDYVDIIQVPFNVLDRRLFDVDFFVKAQELKKIIFVRSVFLQGLLLLPLEDLKQKKMEWAIPHLSILRQFVQEHNLQLKSFALEAVLARCGESILVLGVDSSDQLKDNINLLKKQVIPKVILDKWWKTVPVFPTKLLNPSLW